MTASNFLISTGLGAALLLLTAEAHAQNAASAQLLFDDAKKLTSAGDYEAACPKFVESHRLDPAGGTLLHAADCHERQGKLATAWTEYNEALSFAVRDGRSDREQVARARIEVLTPKLAKVRVKLSSATRALSGLALQLDGVTLPLADAPIPIDAGARSLTVLADGHSPSTKTFTVADGQTLDVELADPVPSRSTETSDQPSVSLAAEESKPSVGSTQRALGLSVGGAGVVGLIVGTVFGIRALSIGDQSERCTLGSSGTGCPQDAVDEQDSARTAGTISTLAFVAGGVLTAGGVILYLTAPRQRSSSVLPSKMKLGGVGRTGMGLSFSGEF